MVEYRNHIDVMLSAILIDRFLEILPFQLMDYESCIPETALKEFHIMVQVPGYVKVLSCRLFAFVNERYHVYWRLKGLG